MPAAEAAPGWPLLAGTRNATAPSHVFSRGDVELLTFEPRQDYAKLWSTSEPLPYGWIMPLTLPHDCVAVKDGKIISGGHFNSDWKRNKP